MIGLALHFSTKSKHLFILIFGFIHFGAGGLSSILFKLFGRQPDGRGWFFFVVSYQDRPWRDPLKEGTGTVNTDL